jgi:hypothetical protein
MGSTQSSGYIGVLVVYPLSCFRVLLQLFLGVLIRAKVCLVRLGCTGVNSIVDEEILGALVEGEVNVDQLPSVTIVLLFVFAVSIMQSSTTLTLAE